MSERFRSIAPLIRDENLRSLPPLPKDIRDFGFDSEAKIKISIHGQQNLYEWAWYPLAFDGKSKFFGLIVDNRGIRVDYFSKSSIERFRAGFDSTLIVDTNLEPRKIFDLALDHARERAISPFTQNL